MNMRSFLRMKDLRLQINVPTSAVRILDDWQASLLWQDATEQPLKTLFYDISKSQSLSTLATHSKVCTFSSQNEYILLA